MKNSFSKKVVCFLLAFSMALSLSTAGVISVSAETEVLYTCNFSGVITEDTPETTTKENGANRTTMSTAFGWSKWADNTSIGSFQYDEEIDMNYIALQDSYKGKGAFSIADSALVSGKLYMSFSYRRPSDAEGNAFIRILDENSTAYQLARLGTNFGLCESMNTSPKSFVGDFEDGKWHVLGLVFDLDNKTITAYADGNVTEEVLSFPSDMSGIQYLGIALNSTTYAGDITDFTVKRVTSENVVSAESRLNGNEISVKLNEALGSEITIDDVSLEICGTDETFFVEDVEASGTNIKIIYGGELPGGREGRIIFGGDCKTLFGNNLPPVYVSIPATPTYMHLKDMIEDESSTIVTVNDEYPNGVIDFEDLTLNEDTDVKYYTQAQVSAPADFYSFISAHHNSGAAKHGRVANLSELKKWNATDKKYTGDDILNGSGNDSNYAFRGHSNWGLSLGKHREADFTGKAVYELDYYFPAESANGLVWVSLLSKSSNTSKRLVKLGATGGEWKKLKVEYDFKVKKAAVYINGSLVGEYTTDATGAALPDDILCMNLLGNGFPMQNADLFVDNFRQYFVESTASVVSVRYVDVDNVKSGLDLISSATKAIEIKFSDDMNPESLENISISDTSGLTGASYDETTYTYTLEFDSLLLPEQPYTLTIPESVFSVDGAPVPETVYEFETGEGIFSLFGLSLKKDGEEITDVSSIVGNQVTVNVEIINTLGEEGDIVLMYCIYEDDALVDVNYDTISLIPGKETLSTTEFTVRTGISPDSAKVFLRSGSMAKFDAVLPSVSY